METVKFIDLFAGLGGTRIGFEQACAELGLESECVFTAELKPYAIKNYNANFNENIEKTDITTVSPDDIHDFDYMLAGIPCQAFSFAGKRKGFADTRGTLFFDVERILKAKKPKGFIIENVEGLVSHDKGRTFETMYNHLTELGYKVSYKVLSGIDFGLAQNRKRIYIVGHLDEAADLEFTPLPRVTFGDVQEHIDMKVPSDFSNILLSHYAPQSYTGSPSKTKEAASIIFIVGTWKFEARLPRLRDSCSQRF